MPKHQDVQAARRNGGHTNAALRNSVPANISVNDAVDKLVSATSSSATGVRRGAAALIRAMAEAPWRLVGVHAGGRPGDPKSDARPHFTVVFTTPRRAYHVALDTSGYVTMVTEGDSPPVHYSWEAPGQEAGRKLR